MKAIILLLALILVTACSTVHNRPESINEAIPEKDDAYIIHEYLQVTGAKKNLLKFQELMIAQMQNNLERILAERLSNSTFGDQSSRSAAILLVNDAISNFVERFGKEQRQLMPFEDLEKKIIGPIIIKYFSTDELIDLITFYKSPIGKKYIDSVDSIVMEITAKTNQEYGQKLYRLSKTIAEEELGEIKHKLPVLQKK